MLMLYYRCTIFFLLNVLPFRAIGQSRTIQCYYECCYKYIYIFFLFDAGIGILYYHTVLTPMYIMLLVLIIIIFFPIISAQEYVTLFYCIVTPS